MTEHEKLIVDAAKAMGINGNFDTRSVWYKNPFGVLVGFNPFDDDADAFRVGVSLGIFEDSTFPSRVAMIVGQNPDVGWITATRWAITLMAAERQRKNEKLS